jgi:hypothetical protein
MGQFVLQLSEFAKKAGQNADLVIKKVAIDILARVIQRSPVDTGRFRGNWQLTVGSPSSGTRQAADKSGATTVEAGSKVIAKFEAGPDIFIVNNLPYGPRLEYEGWSKQAPAGMVRVTVSEFEGLIAKAIGESKT